MEKDRGSMRRLWTLASAALLLGACANQQHDNRFDPTLVRSLRPGVATEEDAIATLGEPNAVSKMGDGNKLLQWQFVYGVGGGAHAAILFGPDRRMIRITHLSEP
jgi:hypothetical protein